MIRKLLFYLVMAFGVLSHVAFSRGTATWCCGGVSDIVSDIGLSPSDSTDTLLAVVKAITKKPKASGNTNEAKVTKILSFDAKNKE